MFPCASSPSVIGRPRRWWTEGENTKAEVGGRAGGLPGSDRWASDLAPASLSCHTLLSLLRNFWQSFSLLQFWFRFIMRAWASSKTTVLHVALSVLRVVQNKILILKVKVCSIPMRPGSSLLLETCVTSQMLQSADEPFWERSGWPVRMHNCGPCQGQTSKKHTPSETAVMFGYDPLHPTPLPPKKDFALHVSLIKSLLQHKSTRHSWISPIWRTHWTEHNLVTYSFSHINL